MNILFYDTGSYTYNDLLSHFEKLGHTCNFMLYLFPNPFEDEFFCERMQQELHAQKYDLVFSVNFFPLVATVCKENNIPYLSWSYDSPIDEKYAPYFEMETNYICLFDRAEVTRYQNAGFTKVFHFPLAVNTERLEKQLQGVPTPIPYIADASFVGQLYSTNDLDLLLSKSNDYIRGYMESIIQAQLRIYGYNLINDVIPNELYNTLNDIYIKNSVPPTPLPRYGFINSILKQVTRRERIFLLEELANYFKVEHFSQSKYNFRTPVLHMPSVDYYKEMPLVFRTSKLNLCPTLRSIQSGMPLRALDITGSGGTLFSNYQAELAENFANDEEVIMYSSMEEAIDKAHFYLSNDSVREAIAQNGFKKTKKCFDYTVALPKLLDMIKK